MPRNKSGRRSTSSISWAATAVATAGPQLRRSVPVARRQPAEPASQPRAPIVQVLGVRHRRRRVQLRDEGRRHGVPRSARDACRTRRRFATRRRLKTSEPGDPPPRPENDKRTLYRVMAWAEEQFHRCLLSAPEAEAGRQYLAERGITDESVTPLSPGVCARSLGLVAGAGPRHGMDAANSRARRSAPPQGARRRLLRLVSRSRDVFDPRRPLTADRLRRPRAATAIGRAMPRNISTRRRRRCSPKAASCMASIWPATTSSRTAGPSSWRATPIA